MVMLETQLDPSSLEAFSVTLRSYYANDAIGGRGAPKKGEMKGLFLQNEGGDQRRNQ